MIGPNLSEWSIRRPSLVIYLMIAAVLAGGLAFSRLGRAEDPAFTFRSMVVQAAWPGATLDDTLEQVTERIERAVQETPSIDRIRSYTKPGVTTIFVDLLGSTPAREVPDLWYDVRKRVGDIRHTLPQGVVGPGFNDDFGDTFGIIYGITADGFTHRELRDYAENIRSRMLQVEDVSKIEIIGAQDEQIFIEFSTERIAALGLDYPALIATLQAQNVVRPAGAIETGHERLSLRVSGAFETAEDVGAVNIAAGGRLVRLSDIATVRRGYADPPQPLFRVNGQEAIGIAIAMRDSGDILQLGRNIKNAMTEITADLPVGIEPVLVADQAVTVDTAIGEFMASLWQAIAIIIVCSFVSLGARPGAVVALAIPLTLTIVFAIMQIVNIDLHRVSLGALIIALTLLVDDAMTTVDAMMRRLSAGDSKQAAATYAYGALAKPMLAGTLITIAGFVPIGFAQSSAGEYTFSIFAVVAIALVVSWFVAVIFAPLLGMAIIKPPKQSSGKAGLLERVYVPLVTTAMRWRWLTVGITILALAASLFAVRFVPRQFFPASDRPDLMIDLTLPQSASIFASDDAAKRLDEILRSDPDVERWSGYVGRGAIRFYLPLNVQLPNDFFSQTVVIAKSVEGRDRLHKKLETLLAETFPEAIARVYPLELGPPVGWPVQYRVSGPDTNEVRTIALKVSQAIANHADTRNINFDWMEPKRQLKVQIDQDQARNLGLSSASLAAALNAAVSGTTITQVRDDIYLVDVIARATDEQRVSVETLRNLQVPLPSGRTVALSQFARFEYGQELPLVWRRDRIPTLTVRADVEAGALPEQAVTDLEPALSALRKELPAGYGIELGGIAEESAQSSASVMAVVPVMLLITLTVLMFHLKSFHRVALVLAVVPLAIIGVVAALLLFNRPLGFVAILGILSLLGMVAKNAVILLTQIEAEREAGLSIWDAVVAAASSRARPILLTAGSTVLGMMPIAPTVFWGPMAFAIMGGLLVASLLTLVLLPTLYVATVREKPSPVPSGAGRRTPKSGVPT
ncbi:ACR family transporter [Terrihabitans soli]|uniref:ACR family transporter n=1 Tax=Terrihabitans soli TaxID=708113 RepID=A0A6S6QSP8_9HYPH|nr:efflux RND transporter permease subunit [Terrihabitans soli]BCJ90977.1 ACR family transporter [Terrihabitans soli]